VFKVKTSKHHKVEKQSREVFRPVCSRREQVVKERRETRRRRSTSCKAVGITGNFHFPLAGQLQGWS